MSTEKATFGAGCFWQVEHTFKSLDGVVDTAVGYEGGTTENPTYEQVCSGTTGHAEVCQVTYDPEKVSYEELLDVFWSIHDPTQVDRQGPDVGDQYRSVVFTHSDEQRAAAEESKAKTQVRFDRPIATQIEPLDAFYAAEGYHQQYYAKNGHEPYCHTVPTKVLQELGLVTAGA